MSESKVAEWHVCYHFNGVKNCSLHITEICLCKDHRDDEKVIISNVKFLSPQQQSTRQ